MKSLVRICSPRSLLAASRCRRARALNVFATEPEWGALAKELGGDKVKRLRRDERAAGPASHRGEAEPDRARAQRRPRRRHRRRARDRLAAARAPAGRATRRSQPGSRATSRRPRSCRCSRCRRGSIAPKATSIRRGNPHIQPDPRNIARVATALAARLARDRPAERGVLPGARRGRSPARWSAAIARWEQQAAPLQGRAGRRRSTRTFTISCAGSACSEVAALEPKPGVEPTAAHLEVLDDAAAAAGEDGHARRLQSDPRRRSGSPSARSSGGRAAVHRRRRRQGEGPVRPVRRHASRGCWQGARNERRRDRAVDPAAGARRRPAGRARRTCRSARRCSRAASSSSTSRSRRSRARRDRSPTRSASSRRAGGAGGGARRGARRRAAADVDRAQLAGGAGGADRRRVRARARPAACCCSRATRTAASTCATCSSARSCGCSRARLPGAAVGLRASMLALWFGAARAARPRRLLLAVRARGDGVGAAGRRLSRVRDADRAAARDAPHATRHGSRAAWALGRRGLRARVSSCRRCSTCRAGRSSCGRWRHSPWCLTHVSRCGVIRERSLLDLLTTPSVASPVRLCLAPAGRVEGHFCLAHIGWPRRSR